MASGTVAVHVGGGYFKPSSVDSLKTLCNTACTKAVHALEKGEDVARAVAVAIKQLEDSPLTNAGLGSCLSLSGCVECDASIMEGRSGAFGGAGAVSGVKNPIAAALTIMETERRRFLELGRIPPMILVGEGCRRWAADHGLEICDPDDLITRNSKATFVNHLGKLAESVSKSSFVSGQPLQDASPENFPSASDALNLSSSSESFESSSESLQELLVESGGKDSKPKLSSSLFLPSDVPVAATSTHCDSIPTSFNSSSLSVSSSPVRSPSHSQLSSSLSSPTQSPSSKRARIAAADAVVVAAADAPTEPLPLDTVGAVAVDARGSVCAGCSSGGISLKYPGRIGQAGCYGCGCWAMNSVSKDHPSVGVCTTGTGEHITKTLLARECALGLCQSPEGCLDVERLVKTHFVSSPMLSYADKKLAGVLTVLSHPNGPVEVGWGHSTDQMILGYYDGSQNKPTALHSCLSSEQVEGHDVQFGTISWMPSR